MNFLETPILDTLKIYLSKNPIRMHVPFHGGNANNSVIPKEAYNIDISEVSGYDAEGVDNPIYKSEKTTANFFNVSHSFYLTGGASAGLLASLIALNKFGKKVIISRNVHKSVVNGLVLSGLEPIWLEVDFLSEWGIFGKANEGRLEGLLVNTSDVAGCVIVSPTYEGVISDVSNIAGICHKENIPLIVDEAHGGHLYFLNDKKLFSSTQLGADIVIQSWHKSLGSLTQSGVLQLANNKYFNYNDIKRSLDLIQSTSPSFLLLLSLELTRKTMVESNGENIKQVFEKAQFFRKEISKIKGIDVFNNDDILKIYLKPEEQSGIDFTYELYKNYAIEIESANEIGFLMLACSNFDVKERENILSAINKTITKRFDNKQIRQVDSPSIGDFKIKPRDAFLRGFENNGSNINSEIEAPCPPGYVINVPGAKK